MVIKSKTKSLKDDNSLEKLEVHVQQIERSTKAGDGYDPTIIKKIEDFTHNLESVLDEVDHDGSIKEKAFLVSAAKQFKERIMEAKNLNCLLPKTV